MPMSAMKARFQIAECSPLYQKKRDGVILEKRYCNEEPVITLFKILIGVTTCYISGDAVMLIYEKLPICFQMRSII